MTQANSLESTHTTDQFLEWYENQEGTFELIEGEIYMTPSAGYIHQKVSTLLIHIISKFLDDNLLGSIVHNFDFYINNKNYFNPDLTYFSKQTLINYADDLNTDAFKRIVPSLVIEIVSPGRKHIDYKKKREIYESRSVPEYWIVDPMEKRFTFLQLKDAEYVEIKPKDDIYVLSEITGLKLDIKAFWKKIL